MKRIAIILAGSLLLSSCSLFGGDPEPTQQPSPKPSPTVTSAPVDPNATTQLKGSSLEVEWNITAQKTLAAYAKSRVFVSRIISKDESQSYAIFFRDKFGLLTFSPPLLSCQSGTYQVRPIKKNLALTKKNIKNPPLYVGHLSEYNKQPTAYLISNNLYITTYVNDRLQTSFNVSTVENGVLITTYQGTYGKLSPLQAVTALSKLDYSSNFKLFNNDTDDFDFATIYEHTYKINEIFRNINTKLGLKIFAQSVKYYNPNKELLYNTNKETFYLYNFEKNVFKPLGQGFKSRICTLPDA